LTDLKSVASTGWATKANLANLLESLLEKFTGKPGAPGETRTRNVHVLAVNPLPIGIPKRKKKLEQSDGIYTRISRVELERPL
jgi:hypothetical protein